MRWLPVISLLFAALLLCGGLADAVLSVAEVLENNRALCDVLRAPTPGLLTMSAGMVIILLTELLQHRLAAESSALPEPKEAAPATLKRPQPETGERPVYFPVREDTRPSAEAPDAPTPDEEQVPQPKTHFFKLN